MKDRTGLANPASQMIVSSSRASPWRGHTTSEMALLFLAEQRLFGAHLSETGQQCRNT